MGGLVNIAIQYTSLTFVVDIDKKKEYHRQMYQGALFSTTQPVPTPHNKIKEETVSNFQ